MFVLGSRREGQRREIVSEFRDTTANYEFVLYPNSSVGELCARKKSGTNLKPLQSDERIWYMSESR